MARIFRNHFRSLCFATTALATVLNPGSKLYAEVVVLYADDFSGPASTGLNGYAPDTRSGDWGSSDTATWASATQFEADGRVWSSPNNRASALLPFSPVSGQLYELSADIDGISTWVGQQDDWVALGFAENGNANDNFTRTATHGYAWMAVSSLGGTDQGTRYAGDENSPNTGSATFATTTNNMHLTIQLDTRSTNWTVKWFLDGLQVTDTHTYITNPDINYVGFSRVDNARAYIDNFQLAVIPEPSSLALTLPAALAIAPRPRRRRDGQV